ncbi:hypothetical protein F5146DRAFT_594575 [Armillaria mellea]|nr:hypothetical protein F5146DRAFT_594575 [Armillaria mellea]
MWTLGYWIHERLEGVLFQPVATVLFWIGKQMQRHLAFHSTLYNLLPASPTASMQNNHEVIFEWPHPEATTVIVTGTFDQWSSSIHLAKDGAGFKGSAQIPWDEKIAYKFIVDGEWSIAPSQPTETDSSGNVNNIYIAPSKPLPPTTTMSEKPVDKQEEVEAGGGGVSQCQSLPHRSLPQYPSRSLPHSPPSSLSPLYPSMQQRTTSPRLPRQKRRKRLQPTALPRSPRLL